MRFRTNVLWGARLGLAVGAVFSAWALAVFVLSAGQAMRDNGTTLPAVLAAYLAGGPVAGGVMGALRPLARWAAGAAVVGFVTAIPVFVAIRLAVDGTKPAEAGELLGVIFFGIVGGALGVVFWSRHRAPRREKEG